MDDDKTNGSFLTNKTIELAHSWLRHHVTSPLPLLFTAAPIGLGIVRGYRDAAHRHSAETKKVCIVAAAAVAVAGLAVVFYAFGGHGEQKTKGKVSKV